MTLIRFFSGMFRWVAGRGAFPATLTAVALALAPALALVLGPAVALVLVPAGDAQAAVSADVEKLPFRRPVLLPDLPAGGVAWIVEDSALAAGATAEFADIRLMDETGALVPLNRSTARRTDAIERPWRSWPLRWSAGDHGERWMTLDLGEEHPFELIVEVSGPSTHSPIRVLGSADSTDWFVLPQNYEPWRGVGPGGKDSGRPEPGFRTRVSEVRRWMRFVQDSGYPPPSAEDEVRLAERFEMSTPREAVGFRLESRFVSGSSDRYEITVTLTGPPRAITRIDLETPDANRASFSFELETRLPRGGWQYHPPDESPAWTGGGRDSLVFYPVRTTALRLRVNGAAAPNAPVTVRAVWAAPDRFGFTPSAGGSYWLGFGDAYLTAREEPPALPGALDAAGVGPPRLARLGAPEANPFHRAPGFGLEWLKRRPIVLSVAMVIVLAIVALLARRPAPPRAAALLVGLLGGALAVGGAAVVLTGCGGGGRPGADGAGPAGGTAASRDSILGRAAAGTQEPLVIFAAASLTEPLTAVAADWAGAGHPAPRLTFDATSRLARQIEQGAPADLFVAADSVWMNDLVRAGRIDPRMTRPLLGNRLVVIVPATPRAGAFVPASMADLARPEVERVALAGEAVPAGRYARAALESSGAWDAVQDKVVHADHVRAALTWVAAGEADAGIVYVTDARIEPRVRVAADVSDALHPPIVYPAGVVRGTAEAAQALAFLDHLRGPAAAAHFVAAGFAPLSE